MSNFKCEQCGADCIDSPAGYITGCKHYPVGKLNYEKKNMKYIYTTENCSKCELQKTEWNKKFVRYEERNASRIKNPEDEIDQEALIRASLQNMNLPVIVELDNRGNII